MNFLERFRIRNRQPQQITEAQIAKIAADAARKMVNMHSELLTPQTKARTLREISEAEQADISNIRPPHVI